MPELPEVETTVRGLRKKVLGRTFIDVWSDWKKIVKRPKNFELFKKDLKNKKIKKVWRRAKNVIFELSGGYSLLVHQKMTGHLMVGSWKLVQSKWVPINKGPFEEKINTFIHVLFTLDNGQIIALSDVRKFAKIELWETEGLLKSKEFISIGPEPLEKSFTFERFKELFKNKKGRVKQIIMKPEIIAGIGNIYASEALWWAKIHPEKNVSNLNNRELKALYSAIKKVLTMGINFGGDSFSDYRNVDGQKGSFEGKKKVYQRNRENCTRCKAEIVRKVIGARSAFFCPKCQKL